MAHTHLELKGCRQHNLKNLSLRIRKGAMTVLTGVSGSGKSSLAFDTIYAEGQRRFLESLSPQARTWIRQLPRPELDHVDGLSPTLGIEQKVAAGSLQGSVGSHSDCLHFLRLLMSRAGEQYSPDTGAKLKCYARQEIADAILQDYPLDARLQLIAPIALEDETLTEACQRLLRMGYLRLRLDGVEFEADTEQQPKPSPGQQLEVVVDRIVLREGIRDRLGPSIETVLDLSRGTVCVQEGKDGGIRYYSEIYRCPTSGRSFPPLSPQEFNRNSPHGACSSCGGEGGAWSLQNTGFQWDSAEPICDQVERLLDLLPRTLAQGGHAAWQAWIDQHPIPEAATAGELAPETLHAILNGDSSPILADMDGKHFQGPWQGVLALLRHDLSLRKSKSPVSELDCSAWEPCTVCDGTGLKPEALCCRIGPHNIVELCRLSVEELYHTATAWRFEGRAALVAKEVLPDLLERLNFLMQAGLGYLSLERSFHSLSAGEAQRVQLSSQLGASLSGVTYVLDEPSLGLHPREVSALGALLRQLQTQGNTVILVEHHPVLIALADELIEIGPGAGRHGGQLCFQGALSDLKGKLDSPTGNYLAGRHPVALSLERPVKKTSIQIKNANLHNLKDVSLKVPLGLLVGFCGVSGSGKSTLVLDVIADAIHKHLRGEGASVLQSVKGIQRLQRIEQRGPGVNTRSLPCTFVGLMTPLRKLFAETRLAKARGYSPGRFSLNKRGGRCEACEGLGQIRIQLDFMPDVVAPCHVCEGRRYNFETLQATWKGRSIADVFALSAEEALELFQAHPEIGDRLRLMTELGLDYLQLGQPFSTLSGGELQRLKLVAELAKTSQLPTLYVLDEPSRGLHPYDVAKLIRILQRLVDAGHSVWVIEHNRDLLLSCDWLVELGPEGGPSGGELIFEGRPTEIARGTTATGKALAIES